MPIIGLSDFVGEYNIAINSLNEAKVLAIIERREQEIMEDLLGIDLYNKLKATTIAGGTDPDVPELTKIFERFREKNGCYIYKSEGIKVMLACMCYMYIAREGYISNTSQGDIVTQSEISQGYNWNKAVLNYNKGMETYNAIQHYCIYYSDLYPAFEGTLREYQGII